MTSPITDAMVEAALLAYRSAHPLGFQKPNHIDEVSGKCMRAALEAALPSALASAEAKGFAAGVEAAVPVCKRYCCNILSCGAPEAIRALRPPAAPAESGPDLGLSDGDVRFPPPLSASEPAGAPSEEDK